MRTEKTEDYIILIHKYGYENLTKKVIRQDLYDYLTKHGVDTKNPDISNPMEHVIREAYEVAGGGDKYMRQYLIFRTEAYYRYLDYMELRQALKNSRQAMLWAFIAIVVTALAAIAEITSQIVMD